MVDMLFAPSSPILLESSLRTYLRRQSIRRFLSLAKWAAPNLLILLLPSESYSRLLSCDK
jgi:hypothetical protein